jgi:NCS1 family nucleobase:cation symporter-1
MSTATADYDPQLYNEDLRPSEDGERTWTWWNYTTVWMGMVHNIVAYITAASLLELGMSAVQAILTVVTANVVLILAMCANSVAGAKYGLPFPVLIRAAFGSKGAQIPVIVRAIVAMVWFAIQTYAGSVAINAIIGALVPAWKDLGTEILGMGINNWLSFALFWALHAWIIGHGMRQVRFFELWAGPLVIVMAMALVVWAIVRADGLGPLFSQPSEVHGAAFWALFGTSVTGLVGTWSTLVLNIPDFTRFARSQRDQVIGQVIGLPVTTTIFALMSIIITSGTVVAFGKAIPDPVQLLIQFDNTLVLVVGGLGLLIATLSVNIAANVVSPAYDLVNLFPRRLTFVSAGIVSTILAVFAVPWLWFEDAERVYNVLNIIGGALGPVAGIMLVDFFVTRRRTYDVASFYTRTGQYEYQGGWHVRGLAALAIGMGAALIGHVVPALDGLSDYAWFVGIAVGGLAYWILMPREPEPEPEPARSRRVAASAPSA